jgi:hypothetical protein
MTIGLLVSHSQKDPFPDKSQHQGMLGWDYLNPLMVVNPGKAPFSQDFLRIYRQME